MVREALYLKMLAADGNEAARTRLVQLGMKHAEMGIGAHLYELWLDACLSTVEEIDPRYDQQVEQSWRSVLRVGITIMTSVS
jgi:hemoglobin-like flavoprotein